MLFCKIIKQPTKDITNPCSQCDSCNNDICIEYGEITSTALRCIILLKRTMKYHCKRCKNYENFCKIQ